MKLNVLTLVCFSLVMFYYNSNAQNTHSMAFDGTNDYVLVDNNTSLMISGSISINAWINIQGNHSDGYGNIVFKKMINLVISTI